MSESPFRRLIRWLVGGEDPPPTTKVRTTPVNPTSAAHKVAERPAPQPPQPATPNRIVWNESPPPPATRPVVTPTPQPAAPVKTGGIEWSSGGAGAAFNPASLIGVEDAFDHTPLLEGEQVGFCSFDKVAYHLSTWQFLKDQNRGACCICGRTNTIQLLRLPGTLVSQPVEAAPPKSRAGYYGNVIRLEEINEYIDRAVTVQAYVYDVYQTINTGTVFIKFEPRQRGVPVYEGFKLVVFPKYHAAWARQGLDISAYKNRYILVRGIVQEHPKWGLEIIVNGPEVIQVVEGAKGS